MSESDDRCFDEEGDPCGYFDECDGNPCGWSGCIIHLATDLTADAESILDRLKVALAEEAK